VEQIISQGKLAVPKDFPQKYYCCPLAILSRYYPEIGYYLSVASGSRILV